MHHTALLLADVGLLLGKLIALVRPSKWTGVVLGVAAGLLYLMVGSQQQGSDSHYRFAQAFLEGRLHIEGLYSWLELVPRADGGWYTPFPPLLSLGLVPFAALAVATALALPRFGMAETAVAALDF